MRTITALRNLRDYSVRIQPDDLFFCNDSGERFGTTWWNKRFRAGVDAVTINDKHIDRVTRNLSPHSFRHTLNTLLRDSGHDPVKIRAALGCSQERIQENYTHWQIEHLREHADSVDTLFS